MRGMVHGRITLGDYRAIVELDCPGKFTPGDSGTMVARRRRCVRINSTAWRHDSNEPTSFPFSKTEMRPEGGSVCCCGCESTIDYSPKAPSVLRLSRIGMK